MHFWLKDGVPRSDDDAEVGQHLGTRYNQPGILRNLCSGSFILTWSDDPQDDNTAHECDLQNLEDGPHRFIPTINHACSSNSLSAASSGFRFNRKSKAFNNQVTLTPHI